MVRNTLKIFKACLDILGPYALNGRQKKRLIKGSTTKTLER